MGEPASRGKEAGSLSPVFGTEGWGTRPDYPNSRMSPLGYLLPCQWPALAVAREGERSPRSHTQAVGFSADWRFSKR